MHFDLIIIGGGPGGYTAAIRAAQLGKKAALIERERVGGTCLNHGCIPTKTFYRTAEVLRELKDAAAYGIAGAEAALDLDAARGRKQQVVEKLTGGVSQLLKANGVAVIEGEASFTDAAHVRVNGETHTADAILIATGSKSAVLPVPGMALDGVMDSTEALALSELPERIVIIGGGVIGVEMAGIYRAFGAEVTIVEFLPSILAALDGELSRFAAKRLTAQGVTLLTGTRVTGISGVRGDLTVSAEGKDGSRSLPCTHVLCCAGRVPNLDGLGLERAGVAFDRKGIQVDADYRTNVPGIYAIGDVTGRVMLAHVAADEGKVCVERLAGMETAVDYPLVPACVFAFPELATVGRTEEQLKAEGTAYTAARFQFAGNGKALALGEPEGFVKILARADLSEFLGVHIAGAHASDLLHEAVMVMRAGLTVEQAAHTMHAHPSLSEALMEGMQRLIGEAIHVPPKRRL